MITEFKIFESVDDETTLVLNDLMIYYNNSLTKIRKFIMNLLKPYTLVKFNIRYGYDNSKSKFLPIDKDYIKGVIDQVYECTIGYTGTLQHKRDQFVVLSLILKNNIEIEYRIDGNSSFTIYGDISEKQKDIIKELNLRREANKFNI
jgi:hypothetical protein